MKDDAFPLDILGESLVNRFMASLLCLEDVAEQWFFRKGN